MLSNVKYHLLKMVSSILCRMPYKNILAIGSFLGPAIMNRIPKQRNRGIEQIMTGLIIRSIWRLHMQRGKGLWGLLPT